MHTHAPASPATSLHPVTHNIAPAAQDKPNDREVEELLELFEQTEAPLLRIVQERVHWHGDALPRWMRAVIITGSITMCIACTAVRYYGSKCFTVRCVCQHHEITQRASMRRG